MKVGIGLPNPIPGTPGRLLIEWARRAEELGFTSLATIDRLAYPSYESMTVLAAAAAATERLELIPNVLVAPSRNPVLLAKEAATVDQVSGGRLTLGIGVGNRPDDFEVSDTNFHDRGRRVERMIETMQAAWRGDPVAGSPKPVTPRPVRDEIPLLIGGGTERSVQRAARFGVGWTAGGLPPDAVKKMAEQVKTAFKGRQPRIVALVYYGLGDSNLEASLGYLRDYYAFTGDFAETIAQNALRSAEAIKGALSAYEEAGVTDLILDPTVADIRQVDMLAEIVL
ncbi:MAG: TIGR03619 family F420-dependent LLM class oxidoreductase [Dehalococcoidia bacterium]|nr:TIGR03619 family F420-dependent LLM class oxidoreductase [Dehalococcoidia bacterium]